MLYTAHVPMPNGVIEPVPLEITRFNRHYEKDLHPQAPSGWAVHRAYSDNRFDNPLHTADVAFYGSVAFYDSRGQRWFGEIFHDTVEGREPDEGEACPGEGFVPVTYTINPGRNGLLVAKTWLPPQGYLLPVRDEERGYRFFRVVDGKTADGKDVRIGTLVPEKVALFLNRAEAEKAFSEFNLPQDEISGFYRLDDYRSERRFGGRDCNPDVGVFGRFCVDLAWLPSSPGVGGVGSRPAYVERKI